MAGPGDVDREASDRELQSRLGDERSAAAVAVDVPLGFECLRGRACGHAADAEALAQERFRPLVDLYRRALAQYGHPIDLPVGLHTLGYVAATDEEAIETQWPYWLETFDRASRERGWRPPTRSQFDAETAHGAMFVGSPETVAQRIAPVMRALDVDRIDLHYALGQVPKEQRRGSIELLGREVFPRVRELLKAEPGEHDLPTSSTAPGAVASPVRSTHAPAPIAR